MVRLRIREYFISDPPKIVYHFHKFLNAGIPSVVWQQRMEKAHLLRYKFLHMIHRFFPINEKDYTEDFDRLFRPLPEVVAYDTISVDPQ